MTPTDRDRRRVAAELRKCRGGWSSGECYYTIINALGLPDTSREDGGAALYGALADLIEPDHVGDSNKMVDRDALLALADEIEDNDVTYSVSTQYVLDGYARRIREALGVADG